MRSRRMGTLVRSSARGEAAAGKTDRERRKQLWLRPLFEDLDTAAAQEIAAGCHVSLRLIAQVAGFVVNLNSFLDHGFVYPSQRRLAASIKGSHGKPVSDRQVRRAIRFLRERGHLRQENGRGTPKMFPLYREPGAGSEARRSDIRSDMMSAMVGHHVRDGRTSCPPNLTLLKPLTKTTSTPTPPSGPSGNVAMLGDEDAHALGDAADLLRARLGCEVFDAWFKKVAIEKIADKIVIITAPTRYIRSRLANDFADEILACLKQALGVVIVAVEIVVTSSHDAQRSKASRDA